MKKQTTKSGMTIYIFDNDQQVSISVPANPRCGQIGIHEKERYDGWYRIIGGAEGDLLFDGYEVTDKGETILHDPAIVTCHDDLTDDDVQDLAIEILMFSFESIGIECVEHS